MLHCLSLLFLLLLLYCFSSSFFSLFLCLGLLYFFLLLLQEYTHIHTHTRVDGGQVSPVKKHSSRQNTQCTFRSVTTSNKLLPLHVLVLRTLHTQTPHHVMSLQASARCTVCGKDHMKWRSKWQLFALCSVFSKCLSFPENTACGIVC